VSYEDELTQAEYEDAVIEDTLHCQCCGFAMCCGGNECLIVEVDQDPKLPPGPAPRSAYVNQIVLCATCAKAVYDAYRRVCEEMGEEP
jgi:hypothetical protein